MNQVRCFIFSVSVTVKFEKLHEQKLLPVKNGFQREDCFTVEEEQRLVRFSSSFNEVYTHPNCQEEQQQSFSNCCCSSD